MTPRKDLAGIAAVALASSIWGASFVLAKRAFVELPVAHVILYRFVLSAAAMLPILLLRGSRPAWRDVPRFAWTGLLMVPVTFFLQFGGLALTTATSAALIVGSGAPMLAVAGVLFERERLGPRGWAANAVSTLGIVLLVGLPAAGSHWRGDLLTLASIVVSVVWILSSKRLVGRYSAFDATGWILVFGTLFLIPCTLLSDGLPKVTLSAAAWGSLAGLGLGCTVLAYVLWNWGVARVGAAPAGVYLNLEPAVGAVLGVTVLGDPLTAGLLVGGALILAAAAAIARFDQVESLPAETASPEILAAEAVA